LGKFKQANIICPMRLLLLLLLSPMYLAAQGPLDGYMKGARHLDIAPSFSFMRAQSFDGAAGQRYNEGYRGNLLSIFAEYGVTDRFDVVATIPYIFTSSQSGLQDGGFYVKYRPFYHQTKKKGKIGVLFGTGVSFPMSDYQPTAAGALGQRAITVPARLMVQWETPLGIFFNASGGYNWRLDTYKEADLNRIRQLRPDYAPDDPPASTTLLLKMGLPAAHYYIDGWVEWQYTASTLGADYVPDQLDLPQAYGVSYTQSGGTAYYSENGKRGFYLSIGYILGGRNVSRVLRTTVGWVLKI
jgi:hypothetical protein